MSEVIYRFKYKFSDLATLSYSTLILTLFFVSLYRQDSSFALNTLDHYPCSISFAVVPLELATVPRPYYLTINITDMKI